MTTKGDRQHHKGIFPELLQSEGEPGAGRFVQKYANEVVAVSFPKGSIDFNTVANYEALQ